MKQNLFYLIAVIAALQLAFAACKKDVPISDVTLDKTSLVLNVGDTATLEASILPDNASNKALKWTSSNPAAAKVSATGLVTAESIGTATITVSTEDGDKKASCDVRVATTMRMVSQYSGNMRIWLAGSGTATIDWGDGLPSTTYTLSAERKEYSRNYSDATPRTISISGENIVNLRCYSNQLTSLDVSKNTVLTELHCDNNQLTSLDISKNTELIYLLCYGNQLTDLDVSKNTELTYLHCGNNKLTSLDVSKNTALTSLFCHENQLTSLSMGANTELGVLNCIKNLLKNIDISGCSSLRELYCNDNELTSLNVSANTALIALHCSNNKLQVDALNDLFNSLPNVSTGGIGIKDNPGATDTGLNTSIATTKGWKITD